MSWSTISIATLGCKTLTAVGSITGGTNSLVLTSNPGFQIGDKIIVAVGGEAGAGVRGTKGVGGNWPSVSYATTAALLADSPAQFTRAWAEDSGKVYFRGASSWTDLSTDPNLYYTNMAAPKALLATISGVSGNTLTLNTTANVTATNANVYFDNADILTAAWTSGGTYTSPQIKWIIPSGSYALSAQVQTVSRTDWVISGVGNTASKFISPAGAVSVYLHFSSCTGILLRDFGTTGNSGDNGFGFVDQGATSLPDFPRSVWFENCASCAAVRLRADEAWQDAVGCEFGYNNWAYNCESYHTQGHQQYIQWDFQWADCLGGGIVDCLVDSPKLLGGAEVFRSNKASIIRFTGRNATMSSNSSGAFLFDAPNISIENNSQLTSASFSETNPIININSNIQPPDASMVLGGVIKNPNIVQTGRIDGNKTSLINITVNQDNPNVKITGTYPDGVNPKGYMSAPDYVPTDTIGGFGGIGVRSSGSGTIVTGIRFANLADYADGHGNIHAEAGSITVTDCVMDHAVTGSATITETGTQTNAAWLAGH